MEYESNMELVDSAAPAVETPKEEAPSTEEPTKVDAPESPKPESPEEVKSDEPVLYDLPDGRKVDAEGLKREYENLLPEFTRKSQELAALKEPKDITKNDEPEWKSPDYVPKDYAEVIQLAKEEAIKEIQSTYQAEQERITSIHKEVEAQVAELKTIDPTLDENVLFQHANKYGFQNLKAAHSNMADMKKAILDTEARTVKNIKTREADPVSSNASGKISESDGYDPREMSQYSSASEYLARLKNK